MKDLTFANAYLNINIYIICRVDRIFQLEFWWKSFQTRCVYKKIR